MSLPSVSCIALAFGRVSQLEQAIGNFLAQKYDGERELIILNSFPKQTLKGEFPNVRIINLETRPPSLGECRNIAIEAARGECIFTFDEDDLHHSNFIQSIAKHFDAGTEWVWLDSMFFSERGQILKITTGSPNVFAARKSAWLKCGKFEAMNCGEDKQFIGKVSTLPGKRVRVTPHEITFIYGWGGNSSYHISGHGFDMAGDKTGYEKVGELVEQQAAAKLIPTGEIILTPTMRLNPDRMIADWLDQHHPNPAPDANDVCLVQLGRYGDCVSIMPVALHIHNTFAKPYWMISREFAPLLDGISYVHPVIVDLKQDQVHEAIAQAQRRFRHVLVTQVWGQNWQVEKQTASYNRESWRLAGFASKFDDFSWKPLFDRRSPEREAVLLKRSSHDVWVQLLLINVTRGVSSPYPRGQELLKAIQDKFGERFCIVNIAELKLERIYDVLGLMENCSVLVSCDTAHLHLSAAVDCPTIAICNDKPWLGTEVRHENHLRFTYADSVETIIAGMEKELRV